MASEYIERRDGASTYIGSRVPLARIVYEFQKGAAPEAIRLDYPTLNLQKSMAQSPSTWQTKKRSTRTWQSAGALRKRS